MKIARILAAVALGGCALSATALDWSDTSLFVNHGPNYKFPGTRFDLGGDGRNYREQDVRVTTYGLQHASGYRYGTNFANIEWIRSNGKDPADGVAGAQGADEIFGVFRHTLSLSAVAGKPLGGGWIRDYGLVTGFNAGTKNNAVHARPFDLVAGPSVSFNVPGFWEIGLYAYHERNQNRFNAPARQRFDTTWQLVSAWGIDFGPGKFKGFVSVTGPKGDDTAGVGTRTETLLEAFYMVDLGQLAGGRKGQFYAGPGLQYWDHKYGTYDGAAAPNIPGFIVSKTTRTPLLRVEAHF